MGVCVTAPCCTKSLNITHPVSSGLDGAGLNPTVLQCTTVGQGGPLPREDISQFNIGIFLFAVIVLWVPQCLYSSDLISVSGPNMFPAEFPKRLIEFQLY